MSRRPLALLACAVVLSGCSFGGGGPDPQPTPAAQPPTDAELIARTLQDRAARIGRAHRDLGVRGARYRLEKLDIRRRTARVQARLEYRIAGLQGRFGSPRTLTLHRVKQGARLPVSPANQGARPLDSSWRVARVLGDRDREPWEVGDYRRERTEHFVVWVPDGVDAPVETLESGYARLGEALDGLEDRYLVVIAADDEDARAITREIEGVEGLTALTDTQVSVKGSARRVAAVRSQRLIVVASTFDARPLVEQEQVVTHELTHAVLAPRTSARTPAWLTEGIALVLSGDDRRTAYFSGFTAVPTLAALSAPDAIGRLTGAPQAAGYATASAAAYYVVDTYGQDALSELVASFNRRDLRGVAGDPRLTDRALRAVLGVGLAEFQRRLG